MPTAESLAAQIRANAWELLTCGIDPDAFRTRQRELWARVEAAGAAVRDRVLEDLRGVAT